MKIQTKLIRWWRRIRDLCEFCGKDAKILTVCGRTKEQFCNDCWAKGKLNG